MTGQEVTDPALIAQLEAQSKITGDDYLKTLDPSRASEVKALAEGRMELPKGTALRSPTGAALLADVAQYDPTFDVANAHARTAARTKFTSGTQGQNITSFNTALGHLGTLAEAAEGLDNGSFPIWNRIANAAENAMGDPRVTKFATARRAVVEELGRAFKGSAPTVHDSTGWEEAINSAQSPAQLRAATKQAAELLQSRIAAMRDSYNAAMGTTDQPLPMLNQHADNVLAKLQSDDYLSRGYSVVAPEPVNGGDDGTPPASPLNPNPANPSPAGPAPLANDQVQISDGSGSSTMDPALIPVRKQVASLVGQGASGDDIRGYLQSQGVNPSTVSGIDELVAWRKANPSYKGGFTIDIGRKDSGPSTAAAIAGSAPGSAVVSAANTALFGSLPKITAGIDAVSGRLGGDDRDIGSLYNAALSGANFKVQASREAHPLAALAGDTAGFITGDAALGALPGVAGLAGRLPGAIRPAVGDALFGAATGLGSSDSLSDIPGNVVSGAALTGAGGAAGRGIVRAGAAIASPVANAGVRRLTDAGITLTPGQILGAGGGVVGRSIKGIEDRLAGFPVVGDIINSTRRGGAEEFNRAAINDALTPIGASLPDNVAVGHDAVAHARTVVSDAYNDALSGLTVRPDAQLTTDLRAAASRARGLSQSARSDFANIMDTDVQPYLTGRTQLAGGDVQALKQGLDTRISNLRGQGSTPQDRDLADRLSDVRDAVLDAAGRSDPASAGAFQQANRAYSMLSRVEGAAAKAKDGIFTPNQFRQAVTKRGYGTTTANVASGNAPMQQLATDASTILPSTVPDSGTAGRAALGLGVAKLGGAALGGGAGFVSDGQEGALTGAVLGGALLSRPGARAAQWALAGSRGARLNTLGDLLRRNAGLGGAVTAPLLLSRLSPDGN